MDNKSVGYLTTTGFTLVEMAIVLLLMGIVMTMGLKIVTATLNNSAYSDTKAKQERIKVALIGYLRAYGELPCPDNTAGVATGAAAASCAGVTQGYGVIPWQHLGISRDTVIDGWGNYFSYRVANGAGTAKNWASKNLFDIDEINKLPPLLELNIGEKDSTGATINTISNAVVVIISHGNNGFGAKTVKVAARMPTAGAGVDEITNASSATSGFVRRPVTEGIYDDLVAHMTPLDLLQPLLDEKTISACKSYCPGGGCPPSAITCVASNVPIGYSTPTCICP
jgi:prepilin-type N-terminal cleavage/methylation domain-containing protein